MMTGGKRLHYDDDDPRLYHRRQAYHLQDSLLYARQNGQAFAVRAWENVPTRTVQVQCAKKKMAMKKKATEASQVR